MDRKLDFLVKELRRLGVAIAGIQETKWFGKDMWTVDGYTLLHSGCTFPDEAAPQVRNEGVGILSVIRSFHKDMTAVVRVGNDLTEDIEVTNGLRQGCTLAPTLFNLYFSDVVECWRARCPQAGVTVRYKIGRKLVGDRTAKARLLAINMTESQFADDVAVYATTREALEQVAAEFVNTAANWGLTVSLEKTKLLTVGKQLKPEDNLPVQLDGGEIAIVEDFTYLGISITRDGEVRGEVNMRLGREGVQGFCLPTVSYLP